MRIIFLLLLVCCVYLPNVWARGFKRTVEDVPNPMNDPLSCGRPNVPRSAVCDPDHLLTKDKQDELEGYMNAFTLAEAAVVVIKQMDLNSVRAPDVDLAAERYARGLHDRYGVGSKETQNGILVFLSIEDRAVYISTGKGVSEKLHKIMIDFVIEHMKPELRKGDYGGALATCLTNIDVILSGRDEAMIAKAYKHHQASVTSKDDNDTFYSFFWLAVFGGFLGWVFWKGVVDRRRIQSYDQGRRKLEKLVQEMESSQGNQNKFEATSCPICLEDFDVVKVPTAAANNLRTTLGGSLSGGTLDGSTVPLDSTAITSNADITTPVPPLSMEDEEGKSWQDGIPVPPVSTTIASKTVSLRCGHIFCLGCMEEYLKSDQQNRCPICRKSITGDDHHDHGAADGLFGSRPGVSSQARQRRVPGTSGSPPNNSTPAGAPPTTQANNSNNNNRFGLFSRFGRRNVDPYNYDGYLQGQTGQTLNNNGGTGTATATMTEPPQAGDPHIGGTENAGQQQPPPPFNNMHHNNYDPYYNNPFGYSNRRFGYYAPEWRFRLHRMHYMYPSVVDYEVLRTANAAIDRGNLGDLHNQLTARGAQIRLEAEQLRKQMEAGARARGASGSSRSSFGGGSSSGGGGGRW